MESRKLPYPALRGIVTAACPPGSRQIKSLRVRVSPDLYWRISEFRFKAKLETRALLCILNAGLHALAKPPTLPPPAKDLFAPIGAQEHRAADGHEDDLKQPLVGVLSAIS